MASPCGHEQPRIDRDLPVILKPKKIRLRIHIKDNVTQWGGGGGDDVRTAPLLAQFLSGVVYMFRGTSPLRITSRPAPRVRTTIPLPRQATALSPPQ